MPDTTHTPHRLAQVYVPVQDLERALGFYHDLLGFPQFLRTDTMAFLLCGETRLMLSRPEGEFAGRSPVLYYQVDDIDAAWNRLEAAGAQHLDRPHKVATVGASEIWMAFFRDPEGNILALTSERKAGA